MLSRPSARGPGGRASGGRIFQHQPGRTRGPGVGRRDCGGHGGGGTGGNERPIPTTEKSMVEGRRHMGHALERPGDVLPDRLHPGNRQSSVTERSGTVCKEQHRPLPGIRVPLRSRTWRGFTLPREEYTLPHQNSGDPGQGRPHVCWALVGHPQATLEGTPTSGLDITWDLESYQHQD